MITCLIRYEIDPYKADAFETYARAWDQTIPRCGADLIGYFAPHEGSLTTAYALLDISDLADYEAYKAHLREDPQARENLAFARKEQFIRREDRLFLRRVAGPRAARRQP
jgi:hypothetical protein